MYPMLKAEFTRLHGALIARVHKYAEQEYFIEVLKLDRANSLGNHYVRISADYEKTFQDSVKIAKQEIDFLANQ
jgi:hypothetical protein